MLPLRFQDAYTLGMALGSDFPGHWRKRVYDNRASSPSEKMRLRTFCHVQLDCILSNCPHADRACLLLCCDSLELLRHCVDGVAWSTPDTPDTPDAPDTTERVNQNGYGYGYGLPASPMIKVVRL